MRNNLGKLYERAYPRGGRVAPSSLTCVDMAGRSIGRTKPQKPKLQATDQILESLLVVSGGDIVGVFVNESDHLGFRRVKAQWAG